MAWPMGQPELIFYNMYMKFSRACGAPWTFTVLQQFCNRLHFYHLTAKPPHFYHTLTLCPYHTHHTTPIGSHTAPKHTWRMHRSRARIISTDMRLQRVA